MCVQVIYDWLAPEWGWGNPGTITEKGFPVVSTLGLYISSDQDNTNWMKWAHHMLALCRARSLALSLSCTMLALTALHSGCVRYYESHPLLSNPNVSAPHGRGWYNISTPAQQQLVWAPINHSLENTDPILLITTQ